MWTISPFPVSNLSLFHLRPWTVLLLWNRLKSLEISVLPGYYLTLPFRRYRRRSQYPRPDGTLPTLPERVLRERSTPVGVSSDSGPKEDCREVYRPCSQGEFPHRRTVKYTGGVVIEPYKVTKK